MAAGIPVIDISPFLDGSDRQAVAERVDAACRDVGFFVIEGHGFDLDLLRKLRQTALEFFRLPLDQKLLSSTGTFRGYQGLESESLSYSLGDATPPDLKETYTVGRPDKDLDDPYFTHPVAAGLFLDNVYPVTPPQLGELSIAYYSAMSDLSEVIMQLFAVALGLPPDYFEPVIDKHFSVVRLNYYPPFHTSPLPGQLRAGAHTDYGTFTLVHFDEAPGGLQVRHPAGTWIDVPAVGDAFVCNIGDLFEVWTNDRWVSTLHRVAVPPIDQSEHSERLSVLFFHDPNWDAVVAALPTCIDDEHPPRYESITAGEHIRRKILLTLQ